LHWVRPNHLDRQSKKATFLSQRGGTDAANIFGRGAAVVVACNNRRPSCGIGHRGRAWIRRATKAARKNANAIGASGERQVSQGGVGKAGRSSRDGTRSSAGTGSAQGDNRHWPTDNGPSPCWFAIVAERAAGRTTHAGSRMVATAQTAHWRDCSANAAGRLVPPTGRRGGRSDLRQHPSGKDRSSGPGREEKGGAGHV